MDATRLKNFVETIWDDSVVPTLTDYIRIPNKSPAFDPEWQSHGYMRDAVQLMAAWARDHLPSGATLDTVQLPGRTPLMFIEIPGASQETILLYGHLDKQPEMAGWAEGTGPWTPVRVGDKLFGRGGADDGYAIFAALIAVLALRDQKQPHARCVIVIEACEESGSPDLPFYVDHLAARIGEPSLVICLDSGCGDYERLWLTTSLRGMAAGTLTVRVLDEGVHSGDASGVVPSSFRILGELLARLEDQKTGGIVPAEFYVQIPPQRIEQARGAAEILGDSLYTKFPFAGTTGPVTKDLAELVLNRTWRPQLAVIGIDGLPAPQNAGNVMLPYTTARLSLRLPPTFPGAEAGELLKDLLEDAPPHGSVVAFTGSEAASGWNAPALSPWLEEAVTRASMSAFGPAPAYMGEGGSIPFMAMLGEKFPRTQFVVTGVLGPHSNAHGPNEFLHIPTGKRVTMAVASIVADHFHA
ncbi:MAG TPA: M20 family metallopeptidase [Rhizomicrobium sp.]|nr:M20 family metallopeptidase [Rhizomicrobium sp.]